MKFWWQKVEKLIYFDEVVFLLSLPGNEVNQSGIGRGIACPV